MCSNPRRKYLTPRPREKSNFFWRKVSIFVSLLFCSLEDESEVVAKEINTLQLAKGYLAEAEVYKKSIDEKKSAVHSLYEFDELHFEWVVIGLCIAESAKIRSTCVKFSPTFQRRN
jgi:hypothetical protein